MILRATERLYTLAVLGAGLVDVTRDRRAADKADGLHVGVRQQTIDCDFVTVNDVVRAIGQTGLLQQFGDEHADRRILLARLQHKRVATRQRVGEHPHRYHRWKVERRDANAHAERLLDAVHVDTRRRLLAVATFHQVGDAAGELDVLQAARDFAQRVAEHLAVLFRQQRRDLLAVRINQLAHVEHDFRAARQVRRSPGGERRLRYRDCLIDFGDGGEVDTRLLRTGRWVVDDAGASGRSFNDLAVDPM